MSKAEFITIVPQGCPDEGQPEVHVIGDVGQLSKVNDLVNPCEMPTGAKER